MRSDDYRHLREAFTEMALRRSNSADIRARWLAVAQACLDLEQNQPSQRDTTEGTIRSRGALGR